jgi:hypothetical protein
MPQIIMAAAMAVGTQQSISSANTAGKSAKSQADTQMRMAQASQDTLVAKEVAAKNELATQQATASSQASATASNKKRAVARSNTIYTSPLGIGGTADVARKVLLGA